MDHVEQKLHDHELECEKRYGVIQATWLHWSPIKSG